MKFFPLFLICFYITSNISGQGLPSEMYLSPDGRMLFTGGNPSTGLYNDAVVRRIDLNFSQANYWNLLTNNYQSKTDIPASMIVDGVTYDSVGVRFKGQTSYSQTGTSQKKSFNISVDYTHEDQDLMGYKTLNLNNSFQDASFMREVFFQHQIRNHIPAAKSAYTKLYINGQNWGLYPNVQQLNKDFLEEWFLSNDGANWRADRPPGSPGGGGGPQWGDGTAALNYHGTDTALYQQYYDLKSSDIVDPWEKLVTTTRVLDTTSLANLEVVLRDYLDIDRTLWHLASEILFSDDDSYIYKGKMDYYVYYEPETGRMTPLEYDGNSVMSLSRTTWSPFYNQSNANYPLMNKLFAVPQLRQRYLAHLRTLINEAFDTTSAFSTINYYKNLIDTIVQNDPKKFYTYTQFNTEVNNLKTFILNRKNFLLSNSEVSQVGPAISNAAYYVNNIMWNQPTPASGVDVKVNVTSTNGISQVNLYYATGIVGNFNKIQMFDDGLHNDDAANDGVYGAALPAQTGGTWVRYCIEAASANAANTVTYLPAGAEHNVFVYMVQPSLASNPGVVINELMAINTTTAADNAGEFDDWLELHNITNQPIDISGYKLTDNYFILDKFIFNAGTVIPANDYLIVWADENGSQGPLHANFKLSGSGEQLMLLNTAGEQVDEVTFGQQQADMGYARVPNGTGPFVIQFPTFAGNNNTSSIAPVATAQTFSVFPNPARNNIRIISNSSESDIEITNTIGQVVFSQTNGNDITVNITQWQAGLYIIRCGSHIEKLIVHK